MEIFLIFSHWFNFVNVLIFQFELGGLLYNITERESEYIIVVRDYIILLLLDYAN